MSIHSNLRRFAAVGALSLMAATQASAHSFAAVTAVGTSPFLQEQSSCPA